MIIWSWQTEAYIIPTWHDCNGLINDIFREALFIRQEWTGRVGFALTPFVLCMGYIVWYFCWNFLMWQIFPIDKVAVKAKRLDRDDLGSSVHYTDYSYLIIMVSETCFGTLQKLLFLLLSQSHTAYRFVCALRHIQIRPIAQPIAQPKPYPDTVLQCPKQPARSRSRPWFDAQNPCAGCM